MELLEVSEHSFLPVTTSVGGQNLVLQGFRPTQFINDGGGGTYELVEEFAAASMDAHASFLQVVEPSPTVVVNYIIGPNGSLIPVYDSIPVDNTVTIVTASPDPVLEKTVPPHMLDHMYARKPKEPGAETPKPRKRVRKKEPPPPVVSDYLIPEIMSPNTTKVNIIRKGLAVSTPQTVFRPMPSSRPKILQSLKTVTISPQRAAGNSTSTNDLTSTPSITIRTSGASSLSPVPTSISRTHRSGTDSNDLQRAQEIPISSVPTQTPSIYFLPSTADPKDVGNIIGSAVEGTKSTKASFIVTSTDTIEEGEHEEAEQSYVVIPPTSLSSSSNCHRPLKKADSDSSYMICDTGGGQMTTFRWNGDGTVSALLSPVSGEDSQQQSQQQDNHYLDTQSELTTTRSSFTETSVESTTGDKGARGCINLNDSQIFIS